MRSLLLNCPATAVRIPTDFWIIFFPLFSLWNTFHFIKVSKNNQAILFSTLLSYLSLCFFSCFYLFSSWLKTNHYSIFSVVKNVCVFKPIWKLDIFFLMKRTGFDFAEANSLIIGALSWKLRNTDSSLYCISPIGDFNPGQCPKIVRLFL